MTISISSYGVLISAIFGVFFILACFAHGMWVYQIWATRGFYLKDFEKLSLDGMALRAETVQVRQALGLDITVESSVKFANMELVSVVEEWDTGISVALAAWEDMMHSPERDPDIESGREEEMHRKLGRKHRRYIIGIMRMRSIEAIEKSRALSPQLQKMYSDVISRYAIWIHFLVEHENPR
jgi:hypothetical protein